MLKVCDFPVVKMLALLMLMMFFCSSYALILLAKQHSKVNIVITKIEVINQCLVLKGLSILSAFIRLKQITFFMIKKQRLLYICSIGKGCIKLRGLQIIQLNFHIFISFLCQVCFRLPFL